MQNSLIPLGALVDVGGEPRIRDIDLAQRLAMAQPLNIRQFIASNRDELEMHGSFHVAHENPGKQGGRPGKAYFLNEGQALVICALSRTSKAVEVRKALIDVFTAYRSGKIVHVTEHRRRLPGRRQPAGYEANLNFLRSFADKPEAMLSLLAGMLTRLDELESSFT